MKRLPALLLLALSFSSTPLALHAKEPSLAFTHVTVIDVASGRAEPNMTVVIEGTRITDLSQSGKVKMPRAAKVIDATGKFLIPGLWDMHVHIFNNTSRLGTNNKENYFPLLLVNGVTGVRDMWTDPEDIKLARQWQMEMETGTTLAPRIAVGSSIVDGVPTFLPNALGVSTPDEARRTVRMLKDAGAGFIKVYWNLSPEAYYAIADESRKLGIPFAGHVPFALSAADVSDAGQKSIEHLTGLLESCSSKEDELRKAKNLTPQQMTDELWRTYDEQKCRSLYVRFAKNKTWHTPTIVLHRMLTFGREDEFRKDARLKYVPANESQEWQKASARPQRFTVETRRQRYRKLLETIGIMHKMGVPLLAGTDLGNPFLFPGFSLHDELELFVQAGLTPLDALRTATVNPAKYLNLQSSLGTVKKGKLADLVLLDANPLADIRNTRRIAAVVLGGKFLAKEELNKMLADVEAASARN